MSLISSLIDRWFIKKPRLRRLVTRFVWGDHDEQIEILGSVLCANTVRESGYHRARRLAACSSLWRDEAPVLVSLALLLRDGDTFIDVGANVGLFSSILARSKKLGRGIRFYAFEAHPDTYERLTRSAAAVGVATCNIALSDRSGTLEFVDGAVSHVFTTVENASDYNISRSTRTIPCARLDELEIEGNSIVLKIDVEGQELRVLEGARELFNSGRIRAVYVDGFKDQRVPEFLRARGFSLLDGRTLQRADDTTFALLAIKPGAA